ncbi:nucleotidyl transferase AbiEii/AbiGii toxin family protein [Proteiniphilum sp.]|uniref:nucleotidyl transferase AbiEii/AbiGii toxin family protein n=1 Tax=Proteiniphilum sp. TaxID=1926877 RepID=UPI00332222B9
MHKEILNHDQTNLLSLLKDFKREFYLVGGTAIALHIGHRRSIDFDLFKEKPFIALKVLTKIKLREFEYTITRNVPGQLNMIIQDVKFTFFEYPFPIKAEIKFDDYIRIPSLLDLSAMKAYALGRRAKWKDYVDMYFIIKEHYSIEQISDKAGEIFGDLFSRKLFRAQLSYFEDVDYSEPVEYLVPTVSDEEIKTFLTDKAIDF